MKIEPGLYEDRAGRVWRVVCVDAPGAYPVIAVRDCDDIECAVGTRTATGTSCEGEENVGDLIRKHEPLWEKEFWLHSNGDFEPSDYFEPRHEHIAIEAGWRKIRVREVK